jgi:lysophospholipase L1-like esterase
MIIIGLLIIFVMLSAVLLLSNTPFMIGTKTEKTYRVLALGDSYTIGEAVLPEQRFISQAIQLLRAEGYKFTDAHIIATTGWTTDELQAAIDEAQIKETYDFVTLLIGVNNQYRGRSVEEYRIQFVKLLQQAIRFSDNQPEHVFVLSIPDWGVTPFADGRDRQQIATEIDLFNHTNKEETLKLKAHYIDITPQSRLAATDPSLTAEDKLHPSAAMYGLWAKPLTESILLQLRK